MPQIPAKKRYAQEYLAAFHEYAKRNPTPGEALSAALYEGTDPNGSGVAIPSIVDGQIVPLAQESGAIRRLASVITTTTNIRYNVVTSPGTVAAKPQVMPFGGTAPAVAGKFELSAFMAGTASQLSMEVVQDLPAFLNELALTLVPTQNAYEEGKFLLGSGVNEPQGMLGNVGAGVTASPDSAGNLVSIDATEDILDTLPSQYHAGASWLMRRTTARGIRRAQRQQGLVDRVWTRENGQDFLHGYPVEFSDAMPAAAPGATPILFGAFKAAYLVGDRGNSNIFIKLLDQTSILDGLVDLLTYRRCDGRVRAPEALQQLTCAPAS